MVQETILKLRWFIFRIPHLSAEISEGRDSLFGTKPVLGMILKDGHEGIGFEKVGTKGRNVSYTMES
jgi:hypothetical protein